jgi:hypothetical protein
MHADADSEKSAFPSSHDEKTLALPTTTIESKPRTRSVLVSSITNPNSRQKRLLAYAAAYATAFCMLKTWQAYQPEGHEPSVNVGTSDGYLNGLASQGWSFISMSDREEDPSVQSAASPRSIEHGKHGKGGHGKHPDHHHGHPPFRHVTPQQAEEIFLKVPSNDSAAA